MPNNDSQAAALAGERAYDTIPGWKILVRCMHPLRVIRMRSLQGPFADNEFVEAAMDTHRKSGASDTIDDRCVALWKIERIGFSYCRHGSGTLHGPSVPVEILPISHTGLGIAAVEEAGLSPEKLRESIDSRAHPDFRHFAYESVGCAWGVYENRSFRRLFETFTGVGFPSCDLPDSGEFMAGFPAGFRPLLSHGYGRTLYFVHRTLAGSIRGAAAATSLDTGAAVQGIAFAYTMINFADLRRVLDVRPDFQQPSLAEAFDNGLVWALAMWSWTFPGFLRHLSLQSDRQAELIDRAQQAVSQGHSSGYFTPPGLSLAGRG